MFYGYGPEVCVAGLKNPGCNDLSLRFRVTGAQAGVGLRLGAGCSLECLPVFDF